MACRFRMQYLRQWRYFVKNIKISFGFCALLCGLFWLHGILTLWLLLGSLLHELGHLICLRLWHVPIVGLNLRLGGAVIQTGWMDYRTEFWCALAGPLTSILAAIALVRCFPQAALVSLALGLANLLPFYPMDGGRMLAALLLQRMALERAGTILCRISLVTCCVLMLLACWATVEAQIGLWPVFVALFLLCRIGREEKQLLFLTGHDRIRSSEER